MLGAHTSDTPATTTAMPDACLVSVQEPCANRGEYITQKRSVAPVMGAPAACVHLSWVLRQLANVSRSMTGFSPTIAIQGGVVTLIHGEANTGLDRLKVHERQS